MKIQDELGNSLTVVGDEKPHNPNQILTKSKSITIRLDYPLDGDYDFVYSSKNGFTLSKVISLIRKSYKKIYDNPGKYGVWGHDIGDLIIEGVELKKGIISVWTGS